MPTPKQVRQSYKRIRYHLYQLQKALNHAHEIGVLRYQDYTDQSPCWSLSNCKDRVWDTTKDALAEAARTECMNELKGVW